ncbi:Hypothetical predicted protein [Paramuricea clavata]|uniref:DUF6589 domain-containing protein n=1 Tax=Paramuricea clavata TaxID=317549 RepID=A0A7D9I793_PARCT|nr:Hypothetical predicted protein [Paramuricea clavata]
MSSVKITPKKAGKCVGRKRLEEKVNDYCRCCKLSLKICYGETYKSVSSENLFQSSKKKGFEGEILARLLHSVGIVAQQNANLSDRLCRTCASKIRKTCEGFSLLLSTINVENPNTSCENNKENIRPVPSTPVRNRTKRALPMSVSTPERSPNARKNPKRILKHQKNKKDKTNAVRDEVDQALNIDDMTGDKTKVNVLILWPNGEIHVRVPSSEESILLVKNIALKKWKVVSNTVFKHTELQPELSKSLWRVLNKEFQEYSTSDCLLKGRSPEELIAFSSRLLVRELQVKCPVWSTCIRGACGLDMDGDSVDVDEVNLNSLALASSIIARIRNKCLSALAYRISSILYHSGTSHQDIIRLNRLGVCMSPNMILHLQRCLGENFDSKVFSWKKEIEEKQSDLQVLHLLTEIAEKQLPKVQLQEDDMDLDVVLDLHKEILKDYSSYDPEVWSTVMQVMEAEKTRRALTDFTDEVLKCTLKKYQVVDVPYFKLVGDNIDHQMYARIQSTMNENRSIHWTHQYAIRDSVVDPCLDNSQPIMKANQIQLTELLPTPDVQARLKKTLKVIVSRIVTNYLPAFKSLQNVVVHHIPHRYTNEVSEKSNICCLGMEFINPNISGEMAQLLITNQDKYVPKTSSSDCHSGSQNVVSKIPFHGDQLFDERARNVKWTFQDGDNDIDCLEGLVPEFADWHAKVTLYEMEYDTFYKAES